jgi:hypothetical protein
LVELGGGQHGQRLGDHGHGSFRACPGGLLAEEAAGSLVVAEHVRGDAGPEQAARVGGPIGEVQGLPQPRHGAAGVRAEPAGEAVEERGGEGVARLRGGQVGGLAADFGLGLRFG